MRKIIAVEFVTLDGFVSGPGLEMDWVVNIYTDEIAQALGEGQESVDTFLLGRVTYHGVVSYWPEKTKVEEPFLADHINPKPKLERVREGFPGRLTKQAESKRRDYDRIEEKVDRRGNICPRKAGKPMEIYPSDLSDAEWALLEPLIPPEKPGGRPRGVHMRAVLNGIFYVLRAGCAWRMLPREYPPRSTVYGYFALCAGQWRLEPDHDHLTGTLPSSSGTRGDSQRRDH